MLTRMRVFQTLALSSLFGTTAFAADVTLDKVTAPEVFLVEHQPSKTLFVVFDNPPGGAADVTPGGAWQVEQFSRGSDGKLVERSIDVESGLPARLFPTNRRVTLALKDNLDPNFISIHVTYVPAPQTTVALAPRKLPTTPPVTAPAKGKSDADIYISGSIIPSVGSGPTYAIDSVVGVKVYDFHKDDATYGFDWLGFSGSVKTDNRKRVDPDSFRWKFQYRHISLPSRSLLGGWNIDWGLGGMEFARDTHTITGITSPKFIHPWGGTWHGSGAAVAGNWEIDLGLGLETGGRVKNDFVVGGRRPSAFILRGVPGAAAWLTFLKPGPFEEIALGSSYEVRLPVNDELFLDTRLHTTNPVPFLRTQARHHQENNISFGLTKAFALTVKHEYGSLPPVFSLVQHRVAIGFTWQLTQKRALLF